MSRTISFTVEKLKLNYKNGTFNFENLLENQWEELEYSKLFDGLINSILLRDSLSNSEFSFLLGKEELNFLSARSKKMFYTRRDIYSLSAKPADNILPLENCQNYNEMKKLLDDLESDYKTSYEYFWLSSLSTEELLKFIDLLQFKYHSKEKIRDSLPEKYIEAFDDFIESQYSDWIDIKKFIFSMNDPELIKLLAIYQIKNGQTIFMTKSTPYFFKEFIQYKDLYQSVNWSKIQLFQEKHDYLDDYLEIQGLQGIYLEDLIRQAEKFDKQVENYKNQAAKEDNDFDYSEDIELYQLYSKELRFLADLIERLNNLLYYGREKYRIRILFKIE